MSGDTDVHIHNVREIKFRGLSILDAGVNIHAGYLTGTGKCPVHFLGYRTMSVTFPYHR